MDCAGLYQQEDISTKFLGVTLALLRIFLHHPPVRPIPSISYHPTLDFPSTNQLISILSKERKAVTVMPPTRCLSRRQDA
jgi:hypothetical protein